MFDALYIGATGMQAQQLNVDTIANNLANVNTPGFKKGRVSFTDLVSLQSIEAARAAQSSEAASQFGASMGLGSLSAMQGSGAGVGIASMAKLFDTADLKQTGSIWDLAINGDGFLQIGLADGATAFTRGGTFKVNSEGLLATQSGQAVKPPISVPSNSTGLTIAPDGAVTVNVPGQSTPVQIGQLQLVRFANPSDLLAQGGDLYRSSDASGEPISGNAGQDRLGVVQQGYLEGSNVKMVDEMVNLMVAQRAYEASVKVVQASDEILGMVNNLRK